MYLLVSLVIILNIQAFDRMPADIIKHLLTYVVDQSDPEIAYSNLHAFIRFMRINKKCRLYGKAEYEKLLAAQTHTVDTHYEEDFVRYNSTKVMRTYLDATLTSVNNNYQKSEYDTSSKKIGCAIQRPCLVWLHHFFKTKKSLVNVPLYHIHLGEDHENRIMPLSWAIYMNSEGAQELLAGLYDNKDELVEHTERALLTKNIFDRLNHNRICIEPMFPRNRVWNNTYLE